MEELVKTGDYAALAAHCEDVELKVFRVFMLLVIKLSMSTCQAY